jgi:hypothetical protein
MTNAYFTTLGVIAAVLTVVALATMVLPGWAGPVTAENGNGLKFKAELSGEEEVTTPPGGVDTETTGEAKLRFNSARTELEFELEVEDGIRVTQAHIHCAPEGQNGPVVVFLAGFHDKGWDVDGDWIGDATATDANIFTLNTPCGNTLATLAQAMADGNAYVNVHTVANPAGEVRGQIEGKSGNGSGGNDHDDEEDDD